MSRLSIAILALSAFSFSTADARSRREDTRSFDHFAKKKCETAECSARHPEGEYTFPYHEGKQPNGD